jgi:hypothetical protein
MKDQAEDEKKVDREVHLKVEDLHLDVFYPLLLVFNQVHLILLLAGERGLLLLALKVPFCLQCTSSSSYILLSRAIQGVW